MIEDKELRDLFRMECEEHLQCLDDGLLRVGQHPSDANLLEEVFRAAHSIKGSARMLGLNEIQSLTHALESALGAIKKGEAQFNKNLAADLCQKLASIRQLVVEAVGASVDMEALPVAPALPVNAQPEPAPDTVRFIADDKLNTVAPVIETVAGPAANFIQEVADKKPQQTAVPVPTQSSFRIETLRVDPQRLDVLLTQTGELAVTNAHITKRLQELDALEECFEEWMRNLKAMGLSVADENPTLKGLGQMQASLARMRVGAHEDSRRLDILSEQLGNGIRTIRMLPFSTIFNLFPRLVHDLSYTLNKDTELVLEGAEVVADKRILEELKDPIMHLLRNALSHGLEDAAERVRNGKPAQGQIVIRARQYADHICVEVQDDGRGLDLEAIKRSAARLGLHNAEQLAMMHEAQVQALILSPGFSTASMITEISGRGVGLDVVHANVEKLKGSIHIDSSPGLGVRFSLRLPLTLATMRVMIVSVQGRSYALPLEYIQFSRRIHSRDLFTMEGRQTWNLDGQPVAVAHLGELLEVGNATAKPSDILYGTFLRVEDDLFGLIVDELLDETDVMLKAQSQLLKRVRNVAGATILVSGEVCPVLNPVDLLKTLRKQYHKAGGAAAIETEDSGRKKILLLVEDSITTRTQEKRILENAGYQVVTAVDGLDGYNKFQVQQFDGVVSDVEMPKMNGLALTEAIRKDKRHADVPIILVTSLSTEHDQRRGLEVGANAYIVKSNFDQKVLLDCLDRLI